MKPSTTSSTSNYTILFDEEPEEDEDLRGSAVRNRPKPNAPAGAAALEVEREPVLVSAYGS